MTALDGIPLFKGEAMLLSWGDTSSRGKTVTFALHPDECGAVHPFRDLGTGKHGQRFQLVAVPITDDGEPLSPEASSTEPASDGVAADASGAPPQKQPGAASGGAKRVKTLPEIVGMRCNDPAFQEWAKNMAGRVGVFDAEDAAVFVRRQCRVDSRKEILPGTPAAAMWLALETDYLADTGQIAERRR